MRAAARASSARGIRETRNGHWLGRIIFAVVLAEFRRAIAAVGRYEDLSPYCPDGFTFSWPLVTNLL
jgi:hypothetical protein